MELEQPQRVLVFQTAYLGDVILAIPLLRALRKAIRVGRLGLVVREGLKPLLEPLHIADEILEVNKRDRSSRKDLGLKVKNFKPTVVISPHRSFRTACWVLQTHAKTRVGFSDPWTFFAYNKRVKRDETLHDVLRQVGLLKAFGIEIQSDGPGNLRIKKDGEWTSIDPTLQLSDNFPFPLATGFATLREARSADFKPVVVAPGSQWKTKQWTAEGFIQLCQHMIKQSKRVVLIGSSAETDLCAEIASTVPQVLNICGKTTLAEVAGLMNEAEIAFCNDSGPLHIAGLVGAPVVAVFGPTTPAQGYAPWNPKSKIIEADIKCRPCGAHGHEACPIGTHECMQLVKSEEVIRAANELLARG